jgi:hypothetical protein
MSETASALNSARSVLSYIYHRERSRLEPDTQQQVLDTLREVERAIDRSRDEQETARRLVDWINHQDEDLYIPQSLQQMVVEKLAAALAESRTAGLEEAARIIPTNWLDSLLSGSDAVIKQPPYNCTDIENLLRAIKVRITTPSKSRVADSDETGLNLLRQLVGGKNALRQLDVFQCNQGEHDPDCECFWEQCEAWAKADAATPSEEK